MKQTSKSDVDGDDITRLVEAAFHRTLRPGWWQELDLATAYVSETARAAALVTALDDFFYLDKFAIDDSARGEGLARTVWDQMIRDYPSIYWRSRKNNRFNAFYIKEADGIVNQGGWTIFWKGETDFDRIGRTVKQISDLPPDFNKGADDE